MPGEIELIAKVKPKNDAFIGIVDASQTLVDEDTFSGNLSACGDTVQDALEKLDNLGTIVLVDLSAGYIPYNVDSLVGLANSIVYSNGSAIFINDTENSKNTYGLTINQLNADSELISGKSSDISHGFTDNTESDTYLRIMKQSATLGGVNLAGFSSGDVIGLSLMGCIGTNNPTDTTAAVRIVAYKWNGATGLAAMGDAETVLTICNAGTTLIEIFGDGSIATDGTISTSGASFLNLTDGYIPYHVSDSYGLDNSIVYTNGSAIFINDTENSKNTNGLTINQLATDDEIISFKSSDVGHSFTDVTETDTYGRLLKQSATLGGLAVRAYSDGDGTGLSFVGCMGTTDPTDTTPAIYFDTYKSDGGTSAVGLAITEMSYGFYNGGSLLLKILGNGSMLINETTDTDVELGITINQGSSDGEILTFKSSDVGHPFTDYLEADSYGSFGKYSASSGGLLIRGLSSGNSSGMVIVGSIGSTDPTDTIPAIILSGYKSDGAAGVAALGNDESVFQIKNSTTALFTVFGDGDATLLAALTATTIKLSNLTDGYVPYHVSDTSGLADSPIHSDGTYVGIGANATSTQKLFISRTSADVTAYVQQITSVASFTDDCTLYTIGLQINTYNYAIASGKTNSGYLYGLRADVYIYTDSCLGTITTQYAVLGRAGIYGCGVGATVGNSVGIYGEILNNDADGAITNAFAGFFANGATVGTITNRYGIYINLGAGTGTVARAIYINSMSGAATTKYGLMIDAMTGASTTNYGIYVNNISGATTNYSIYTGTGTVRFGGQIFINETSCVQSDLGIVINQGAYDTDILTFKSSDINHGMTAWVEADTYGFMRKQDALSGGLYVAGCSEEDSLGLRLLGCIGDNTPSITTPAMRLDAYKWDAGTSLGALASTELCFQFTNATSNILSILGDGSIALLGTTASTLYHIYVNKTYVNPAASTYVALLATYPIYDASDALSYVGVGFITRPVVYETFTNTGTMYGLIVNCHRNASSGYTDDSGTLSSIRGISLSYGNFNTNAAETPQITTVYGCYLYPYYATGKIFTLYDLYIATPVIGGTAPDTHYSIYQGDTAAKNYFASPILIGDTANAKSTLGLTINQGANDDEIISLKSSDISHPFTDSTEADTFFTIAKNSATYGGVSIRGFTENNADTTPLLLVGIMGSADPTDTVPAIRMYGCKSDGGTNVAVLGNDERVFSVTNMSTELFYVKGDGDGVFVGTVSADTGIFSNLTDGYVPYHASDTNGLDDSPIHTDGTYVAIGTTASSTQMLLVQRSLSTSGSYFGEQIYCSSSISSTMALNVYGLEVNVINQVVASSYSNTGYVVGVHSDSHINTESFQGTLTNNYGVKARAGIYSCGAGGTITTAMGFVAEMFNNDAQGTITNSFGLYIINSGIVGTLTNRYGVYIAATAGSGTKSVGVEVGAMSGTDTNKYGMLINAMTGASTTNYGLYIDDVSGATNNYAIYTDVGTIRFGGNVFIGETANANITLGLTINQGANDNQIIALKSSDVAHGFTSNAEADTFCDFLKASADNGGVMIRGFSDSDANALSILGGIGSTDPTNTVPGVRIVGARLSGTGLAALDASETILAINNYGSDVLRITGGGALLTNHIGEYTASHTITFDNDLTCSEEVNITKGVGDSTGADRILFPGGASLSTDTPSVSGAFRIMVPIDLTQNAMIKLTVMIYDYAAAGTTAKTSVIEIAGYCYATSDTWVNTQAVQVTNRQNDLQIRYGHDGTNYIIWIGEVDTVWRYPKIAVIDAMVGYSNGTYALLGAGWTITTTTDFAAGTDTVTIAATKIQTAGVPVNNPTGDMKMFTYQADALADDGTVNLPDATSGMVFVSCNGEAGMWSVTNAGVVAKIVGSTNTAAADTDTDLCVYDGGTYAIVKNRLGTTGEIRIIYYYN